MKILTIGDSWTHGTNECGLNPEEISWPAQMARKYQVEVVNLAQGGSSNQRAARIGIEELCRNPNYDYVIFPLAPAARLEILKVGKWQQIWPGRQATDSLDKIFTDYWHAWNDIQNTIILSFYFMHSLKGLGIPLFMTGLSLNPTRYTQELSWIMDYKNDNDFNSLNMPLADLDIGINDLDSQLKSLKTIHLENLKLQPEYLHDVITSYFFDTNIQKKYEYVYTKSGNHPDESGYTALADYFAGKIGLT